MKKKFGRSIDHLEQVFDFISFFTNKFDLDPSTTNSINLAVEEIFTNMVKYNPDDETNIQLDLRLHKGSIIIILTDYEEEPFDLTQVTVYHLDQPLEERPIGKLGLHLVKKVMDNIEYSHNNGKTIIKMEKHLGEEDA